MEKNLYTVYSPEGDMTFIMVDTYDADGEPLATECVGWYYGAPNDEDTAAYTGKLKAEYMMGGTAKSMYKVVFEYANGKKGVCREDGKIRVFDTEQEAADFAADLNGRIDEDMKPFFPVYRVEKA